VIIHLWQIKVLVFCSEAGELGEACLTDSDCQEAIENSWCMDSSPDDDSSAEISGICVCQDAFLQVGLLQCRYCE